MTTTWRNVFAALAAGVLLIGLVLGFMSVKTEVGDSCGSAFNDTSNIFINGSECEAPLSGARKLAIGVLLVGVTLGAVTVVLHSSAKKLAQPAPRSAPQTQPAADEADPV